MPPLFSVCTEVTNREKTIQRTIQSIMAQTFRDFEYIIINNHSDDQSDAVIRRVLSGVSSQDIRIHYSTTPNRLSDIKSWNAPLEYATGEYIVVCEGDDWFSPDHLQQAEKILRSVPNIGVYVANRGDLSQRVLSGRYAGMDGKILGKVLMEYLREFSFYPPPSEVIFRRSADGQNFLYNADQYEYAAEGGLYYAIMKKGFDGFIHRMSQTVYRGPSSYRKGLFHLRDFYRNINDWKDDYSGDECQAAQTKLLGRSGVLLGAQIMQGSIEPKLVAHIIKEMKRLRRIDPLIIVPIYIGRSLIGQLRSMLPR